MTSLEWLQTPLDDGRTVLSRFAELIEVNGGLRVCGWGFMSSGGIYGRRGLEQEEALELLFMSGMLEGFMRAENRMHFDEFMNRIKSEIAAVEKGRTFGEGERDGGSMEAG